MGFFDLDSDRIVRIFHANGIKMSLAKAFKVSNIIYEAHLNRLNEVQNNAWDQARKEGDERAEVAYNNGYADGKRHGDRLAVFQAENAHTKLVTRVTIWANAEFSHYDLQTKIRCIKHVREHFPTIDLRTAKNIVECLDGSGVGARW